MKIVINNERKNYMYDNKTTNFKSPDLSKLQEVVIDRITKIYISAGEDPEKARKRYIAHRALKKF